MTALNRAELKEVLTEIFEERSRVDNDDHAEHHQWIQGHVKL